MITKKEYSAADAQTVVLYAKQNVDSQIAYPVTSAMFNPGFAIPEYDTIALAYSGSTLTGVVYTLVGVTMGTLTLSYTDGNLTGVVKT
jgi:hypothetical protein